MEHLARIGFTPVLHLLHVAHIEVGARDVPDRADPWRDVRATSGRTSGRTRPTSCTEELQTGGRAAFLARLVLAAHSASNYGIYGPAFELQEHLPRAAGLRGVPALREVRDPLAGTSHEPDSLSDFVGLVNRIRREHEALQFNDRSSSTRTDNDQLIAYSKIARWAGRTAERRHLDRRQSRPPPRAVRLGRPSTSTRSASSADRPYVGARSPHGRPLRVARPRRNFVSLDPAVVPCHISRRCSQETPSRATGS